MLRIGITGGHAEVQVYCYYDHKRTHCLIYKSIKNPDGLEFYLYGTEFGELQDLILYCKSRRYAILEPYIHIEGNQLYIFGNEAYMMNPWFKEAFDREFSTPAQTLPNLAMSSEN